MHLRPTAPRGSGFYPGPGPSLIRWLSTAALLGSAPLVGVGCASDDPLGALEGALIVGTLDFGAVPVGQEVTGTLEIGNGGRAILFLTLHDSPETPFSLGAVPAELGGHRTGGIEVVFAPTNEGDFVTSVTFGFEPGGGEATGTLRGTGASAASCDDGNPCTDDRYDGDLHACAHDVRQGACDDANACTESDVCIDGQCLGAARQCPESVVACQRSVCDPTAGCVALADLSLCDDGDPCTEERCESTGCVSSPASDGTACGTTTTCGAWPICVGGICRQLSFPEGAPCDDGSACTYDDVCAGGACMGTGSFTTPTIVERLANFSGEFGSAIFLPSGRLLFADGLTAYPIRWDSPRTILALTTAEIVDGVIVPRGRATFPDLATATALIPLGGDVVAAVVRRDTWTGIAELAMVQLDAEGVPSLGPTLPTPNNWERPAVHEGWFFYCAGNSLAVRDLRNPAAPGEPTYIAIGPYCSRLAAATGRLWVSSDDGLYGFDVSDPLAPVLVETRLPGVNVWGVRGSEDHVVAWDSGGRLYLWRDGATSAEIISVPGAGSPYAAAFGDGFMFLGAVRWGACGNGCGVNELHVYDLAATVTHRTTWRPERFGFLDAIGSMQYQGGYLLMAGGQITARVLAVDRAAANLVTDVTGPRFGSLGQLSAIDGRLFTHDTESLRELVVTPQLSVVGGGHMGAGHTGLWELPRDGGSTLRLARDFTGPRFEFYPTQWAAPGAGLVPTPLGAFGTHVSLRSTSLDDDLVGGLVAGARPVDSQTLAIDVFVLPTGPQSTDLTPTATDLLAFPGAALGSEAYMLPTRFVTKGDAAALVLQATPGVVLAALQLTQESPRRFQLSGWASLPGGALDVILADDGRIATTWLEGGSRGVTLWNPPIAGVLNEAAGATIAGLEKLLVLDSVLLLGASATELIAVDIRGPVPTELWRIDTVTQPLSALWLEDGRVLVTTRGEAMLLSPPCGG